MDAEVVVRLATPEDAEEISALIRRCYGDTYCWGEGLDPVALRERIRFGVSTFAIVQTRAGEHVAQLALEPSGPHGLFEHGRAIVAPAFRGRGLFAAMDAVLLGERARRAGAKFVIGKAVTAHVLTQRHCRSQGFVPTGILLGVYPASTAMVGFEPVEQPVSAVVMCHRLETAPRRRRLALAGEDRERAAAALDALGVPHGRSRSGARGPELGVSIANDRSLGLVHLRFGPEGRRRLPDASFVEGLRAAGARLLWADVPVEHAAAPRLVDGLRAIGLGHGAYVPLGGRDGADVLRFQAFLEETPLRPEMLRLLGGLEPLRDAVFADRCDEVLA
jgi:hypothetical protein